ncbi:CHAT domain-containing protein [Streptomyces sp. NPDC094038]|uniref:CHAT domain-containing protein n=1 Tax=Streptomyces sp. NPDC094038 TaxID=3366055 RepID=UPI00381A2DBC
MSTAATRCIASLLDRYLDRHEDLPRALGQRLLELEGFLGGLSAADVHDTANAGFMWARSAVIRVARNPSYNREELPPTDRHLAQLYELLGREYVRFGSWSTAAECFMGATVHGKAARDKRRTFCQTIVLDMKAGDHDGARSHLEVLDGATHRPSAVFHRIASRILDNRPGLGPRDFEDIDQVGKLGVIAHTYLVSCLADRLAADDQPERALRLLDTTIERLAEQHLDPWLLATLEQQTANLWVTLGRHETGLHTALSAWAKIDAQRYRSCSHDQRLSLWRSFGPARRAALSSAVALDDARTVAELIESCRLQSLIEAVIEADDEDEKPSEDKFESTQDPASDSAETRTVSSALFTAMNDNFAATRLRFPDPVSFRGESLLMPHYRDLPTVDHSSLRTRPLDLALPEGLFWSTHIEDGHLFWFVARDGEPLGFGTEDLRRYDRVKPVLLGLAGQAQSSEPKTWSMFPHRRGPGDHFEPYIHLRSWKSGEEQIITRTLGELLPPPLVAALLAAGEDTPVRLTISAARELTCVPWAIVMIPGTEDRLVERAVLRMWTSAPTQLERAGRRWERPAGPPRFLLACDNPDGTLRERTGESIVHKADTVLAARGSAQPADKDTLLRALHTIGPSTHGLFFYRGHARHDSDPAWALLPLTDGDSVQAGELFGRFDDGVPFLPMPAQVVLSCCSSSTAASLGGEGIGLAAGIIQSGAEEVIATCVDIIDASFTEVFEDLLVEGMLDRRHRDHAALLRALHLRMLHEWKIYSLRGETDDGDDVREPHPVIWASYQAY